MTANGLRTPDFSSTVSATGAMIKLADPSLAPTRLNCVRHPCSVNKHGPAEKAENAYESGAVLRAGYLPAIRSGSLGQSTNACLGSPPSIRMANASAAGGSPISEEVGLSPSKPMARGASILQSKEASVTAAAKTRAIMRRPRNGSSSASPTRARRRPGLAAGRFSSRGA